MRHNMRLIILLCLFSPLAAAEEGQQALMRQAAQALAAGDAQRAAGLYEQAATQYSESAEAEVGMVRAHLQAGAFREALSFAYLVAGEHAESAAAIAQLAYLEDRHGQTERALARLKQAALMFKDDLFLLATRTEILIDRGAAARAANELDAWFSNRQPSTALYLLRARAALAAGDRAGSVTWQNRAALQPVSAAITANPLRPTPSMEPFALAADAQWNAGSGAIIDEGRRVLTLARIVDGAKGGVWVRNGLGKLRRAQVEALQAQEGIAVLRLDQAFAIATPLSAELLLAPTPGRACLVMGYPLAESPEPAYPALSAGLVFRAVSPNALQTTVAQSAGFSGAPVFDAQGRWLGLSLGASGQLLRAASLRALLPKARAIAAESKQAGNTSFEELYERFMPTVVQVIAVR